MIPASRQRNYLQSGLYVAIAAVLALIFIERVLTYAEAYEKTRMEVTLSRLHAGLYARLAYHSLRGDRAVAEAMQTESPFASVDWRPPEYLGEFDGPPAGESSGGWYFDRTRHELVYRPTLKRYFVTPDPPAARYEVRVSRSASGAATGVTLVPVQPIRWNPGP